MTAATNSIKAGLSLPRGVHPGAIDGRRMAGYASIALIRAYSVPRSRPFDEGPNEASPMVWDNEPVEIDRAQFELSHVGKLKARSPCYLLLQFAWLSGWELEDGVVHALNRS